MVCCSSVVHVAPFSRHPRSITKSWARHWRRGSRDRGAPSRRLSLWPNDFVLTIWKQMGNRLQRVPRRRLITFHMKRDQGVKGCLDPVLNQHILLPKTSHNYEINSERRWERRRRPCADSRWLKCTEARYRNVWDVSNDGANCINSAETDTFLSFSLFSLERFNTASKPYWEMAELCSGCTVWAPGTRPRRGQKGQRVWAHWPLRSGWQHPAL